MAFPNLITPADLYRNSVLTRYQGSLSDPYGLSRAIGSVGAGYGDMNRELTTGAHAYDDVSKSLANQAAGTYQIDAEENAAKSRYNTDTYNTSLKTRQTIEDAFQGAIQQGLKPGTLDFDNYMLAHVNTRDAAARITPEIAKGNFQAQTRQVQTAAATQGINAYLRASYAEKFFAEKKLDAEQAADVSGVPRQDALKQLRNYALKRADQQVEALGIKVAVDPNTGQAKAVDVNGVEVPIPAKYLAALYAMGGNKTPMDVTEKLNTDQQQNVREDRLAVTAAALANLRDEQAKKAASGAIAAKGKVEDNPLLKLYTSQHTELVKMYNKAREEYNKGLITGAVDPAAKAHLEELKKEVDASTANMHRILVPSSAVVTQPEPEGMGPYTAPDSYDYGMDSGAVYPQTVEQEPTAADLYGGLSSPLQPGKPTDYYQGLAFRDVMGSGNIYGPPR